MKLTLHIGQGKAGSTSIQHALAGSRDQLLDHGCLYPTSRNFTFAHPWLSPLHFDDPMRWPSVVSRMGFSIEAAKRKALEEWEHLERQIGNHAPHHLIISTEALFAEFSEEEKQRARRILPSLADDIRVLAYIRSPISRYISLVQQMLKSSNQIAQPRPSRNTHVLKGYADIFDIAVEVRAFDRMLLSGGDVITDFMEWADVPPVPQLSQAKPTNESVSAEAMSVLQQLNAPERPRNKAELKRKTRLLSAVIAADKAIEKPTRPALRPEIEAHLTDLCHELLLLRDDYGLQFPDIDYSRVVKAARPEPLRITDIQQICEFNIERRDLVLAHAKRSFAQKTSILRGVNTIRERLGAKARKLFRR